MKRIWKQLIIVVCLVSLCVMSGILTACGGNGHTHELREITEQEATCTENGNTTYFKCDACGKLFADAEAQNEITLESVTTPKRGHDVKHFEGKEASCTESGNIEGYACAVCHTCFTDETGTTVSEQEFVIEATGHDYPMAFTEAKNPTVDAAGNIAYYHCSKCKKNFADGYGDRELTDITVDPLVKIDEVTVTLKGYKEGQNIDLNNKTVAFTGPYSLSAQGTVSNHTVTLQNVYEVEYTVVCDGYIGTIIFETGKTDYELRLEYPYATDTSNSATEHSVVDFSRMNDVNHTIKMSDSWGASTKNYTEAKLNLPDAVKNAKYATVSFTVKYGEFRFDSVARFGVKMAENTGVFLSVFNKNELQVCVFGRDKANDTFDGYDNKNNAYAEEVCKALGNGMQVRMVRAGDKIRMFAYLNDEWIELLNYQGVATCATSAETDIRLLILAHEWEFSNIVYSTLEHATANPATTSAAGNLEYYKVGAMYFKPDGTLTTQDEVTLPMLTTVNANIALNGYKDGTETAITGNVQFVNTENNQNLNVAYSNGTATGTAEFYALTYQVIFGDYFGTVTVTSDQTEYTVMLQYNYATVTGASNTGNSNVDLSKMNDTNHTVKMSDTWGNTTINYTETKLNLPNEIKNSHTTTISFTLKYLGGGFDEYANLGRFGVKMSGGKGLFAYVNYEKNAVAASGFNNPNNMFEGESNQSCDVNAFIAAIKGNGLQVRVIRMNDKIRMCVKLNDTWVQLGQTATCDANADTDIRLLILAYEWEFSNIEYSLMEHVSATPATTTSEGNLEHYKVGDMYFMPDGTLTTQEAITLPVLTTVEATFTIKGYKDGAETTLTGNVQFVNAENGKNYSVALTGGSATQTVEALTYLVTCGDYCGTVTVIKDQTSYDIVLQYNYATVTHTHTNGGNSSSADLSKMNDSNHTITMNDNLGFEGTANYTEVQLNLPDSVKNAKYTTVSFTLKYKDSAFDNLARIGVKMTGQNGMFLTVWGPSTTENYLHVCVFGRDAQNDMFNGWDTANNNYVEAVRTALSGDGMQIRMVRANDKIRMFVKLNNTWVELINNNGVATCDAYADTDIRLLILKHEWEFSNIDYSVMEHIDAKAPTTSETGNVEHYKVGDMYFNTDGTLTTQEAVTLPVLTTVNATITLKGYKDGTETAISGDVRFVNAENSKDFTVAFADGTVTQVFDAMTYKVSYGDYIGEVTIITSQSSYTVVLQYNYATITHTHQSGGNSSTVDLSKMNDDNHTITINDSLSFEGTANYTEVQLKLPDNVKNATNVSVTFTLKHIGGDFDTQANLARFGVKMAGGKGVYAFVNYEKTGVMANGFNNPDNMFDGESAQSCSASEFIAALTGTTGLQVRVIRNGVNIYMLVKYGDTWVRLTPLATCAENDKTDIRLLILAHEWEFSNIEYSATTQADVTHLGNEDAAWVDLTKYDNDKTITLTDMKWNGTDKYTEVQLILPENVKSAKNVDVVFTIKCVNDKAFNWGDPVYGSFPNLGRFGVKMAEEKGIFTYVNSDNKNIIEASTFNNPNNMFDGGGEVSQKGNAFLTAIQGDGLQVKVTRNGGTISMAIYLNDEWITFSKTAACDENAETDIRLLTMAFGWEISDITVTVQTLE